MFQVGAVAFVLSLPEQDQRGALSPLRLEGTAHHKLASVAHDVEVVAAYSSDAYEVEGLHGDADSGRVVDTEVADNLDRRAP